MTMSTRGTTNRKPATTQRQTSVRSATTESKAWKAAAVQVFREGTAAQIAACLADLEARGHITLSPGEYEPDTEDPENSDAIDADFELADQDQANLEDIDIDTSPYDFIGLPKRPGETFFTDQDSLQQFFDFELRVTDKKCSVVRPRWGGAEALSVIGKNALDELGKRLGVLQKIGDWLQRERRGFLDRPEPMALGVQALQEIEQSLPSVSPASFLRLSGIDATIIAFAGGHHKKETDVKSLFSRYTEGCHLVWRDGSLPVSFLFGREARKAWVASAVLQAIDELKQPLTKERLKGYKSITIPKNTDEKANLVTTSVDALSFPDFIRNANRMAGTKWSEIIADYLWDRAC